MLSFIRTISILSYKSKLIFETLSKLNENFIKVLTWFKLITMKVCDIYKKHAYLQINKNQGYNFFILDQKMTIFSNLIE